MVAFVAPRVPLVDLRTGNITREWFLLLQQLFTVGQTGMVPGDEFLAPNNPTDVFLGSLAQVEGALSDALNLMPSGRTEELAALMQRVLTAIAQLRQDISLAPVVVEMTP